MLAVAAHQAPCFGSSESSDREDILGWIAGTQRSKASNLILYLTANFGDYSWFQVLEYHPEGDHFFVLCKNESGLLRTAQVEPADFKKLGQTVSKAIRTTPTTKDDHTLEPLGCILEISIGIGARRATYRIDGYVTDFDAETSLFCCFESYYQAYMRKPRR